MMKQNVTLRGVVAGEPKLQKAKSDGRVFLIVRLMVSSWRDGDDGVSRRAGGMGFDVLVFDPRLIDSLQSLVAYSPKPRVRVDGVLTLRDWQDGEKKGTDMSVLAEDVTVILRGQKVTVEQEPGLSEEKDER